MPSYDADRRRLAHIAWLLDNSIPLPGFNFRIGLDAILGLIPGIGDMLGVLLSTYIVREAARLGAPPNANLPTSPKKLYVPSAARRPSSG